MNFSSLRRLIETIDSVDRFLFEDFNLDGFQGRIDGVIALMRRGATPGERAAAKMALERLLTSAKDHSTDLSSSDRASLHNILVQAQDELRKFTGNAAPKTDDAPRAEILEPSGEALPLPGMGDSMVYRIPGTGVQASVKRIHPALVKNSKQDRAYFTLMISVHAADDTDLQTMMAGLGWRSEAKGAVYWSPQGDRLIANRLRGRAVSNVMMMQQADVQAKLKGLGFSAGEATMESQVIDETAPPGEAAERWIKHRKAQFKDRYGKRWKQVLYAKAWKLFGDTH